VRHGACCDVIEACAIGCVGVFRADVGRARSCTNLQLELDGPYLGADAGYVSSRSSKSYLASVPPALAYLNANQVLLFNQAAPDTVSARGILGTLHGGWNWQLKPFAVGIELDAGAFRTRATRDTCLLQPQGPLIHNRYVPGCRYSRNSTPNRARIGCLRVASAAGGFTAWAISI
jgi:hypothetical protein